MPSTRACCGGVRWSSDRMSAKRAICNLILVLHRRTASEGAAPIGARQIRAEDDRTPVQEWSELGVDQAVRQRVAGQFRAAGEAELLLDVGAVGLYGADAEG